MRRCAFTLLELLAALVILSAIAGASAALLRDARAMQQDASLARDALRMLNQWEALGRPGLEAAPESPPTGPIWSCRDKQNRQWCIGLQSDPDDRPTIEAQADRAVLAVDVQWLIIEFEQPGGAPTEVLRIPRLTLAEPEELSQ
ncbi:MAG: type II secretion system protein [Phycisphaerales bacterium]|nr:type II secretion system protein [Phycisphaerales bacterium]